MAALLITIICRLPQAMDNKPQPELEQALRLLFASAELKRAARFTLRRLSSLTPCEWDTMMTEFLDQCIRMPRVLLSTIGQEDPFSCLTSERQIHLYLHYLGWEGNQRGFVQFFKDNMLTGFNKMASGEDNCSSLLKGLFTNELEHTNALRQLILPIAVDDELMETISKLIAKLRSRLLKSPEWVFALCLMENRRGLSCESVEMNKAVNELREKHLRWLRSKGDKLKLSGRHLDPEGRDDFPEELSLGAETVYAVLLKKAMNNPIELLMDAWRGKLPYYLKKAVENDILQEVRKIKTRKRDYTRDLSLDTPLYPNVEGDSGEVFLAETLPAPRGDVLNEMADAAAVADLLSVLSPCERTVIEMSVLEQDKQEIIALKMHHGASWVTKVKQRALRKMMLHFRENNVVAKIVANGGKPSQIDRVRGTKTGQEGEVTT